MNRQTTIVCRITDGLFNPIHFLHTRPNVLSKLISSFHVFRSLQDQFLWDSFQDPPAPLHSGSTLDNKRFDRFKKSLKIITYIFVFVVVLFSAIASKLSYLFMTSFAPYGQRVKYCNASRKRNAHFGLRTSQSSLEKLNRELFLYRSRPRIVRSSVGRFSFSMDLDAVHFVHCARTGNFAACSANLLFSKHKKVSVVWIGIGMTLQSNRAFIPFNEFLFNFVAVVTWVVARVGLVVVYVQSVATNECC